MGHPSKYGPAWVVSGKSGGNDGGDCVHLALVTRFIREEFERERGAKLLDDTTHVARDEHGNWLQLTSSEAWAWVRGAKAGDFDRLFEAPPVADVPAEAGRPVTERFPEIKMLEQAYGLLCSAQPHDVLDTDKAREWSRAFEAFTDRYHAVVKEWADSTEWSCSA